MVKGIFIAVLLILFCFEGVSSVVYAESAAVLPKGVSRGREVNTMWLTFDRRYNESGDIEGITQNYNRKLDNSIFPRLKLLEDNPALGLDLGTASFGRSEIDFDISLSIHNFVFEHGITDKLTAAINIPYWSGRMKVKNAQLNSSDATVGKSVIGANLAAAGNPNGT